MRVAMVIAKVGRVRAEIARFQGMGPTWHEPFEAA